MQALLFTKKEKRREKRKSWRLRIMPRWLQMTAKNEFARKYRVSQSSSKERCGGGRKD